jgi:hypothetical protein
MNEIDQSDPKTGKRSSGIGRRISLVLIGILLLSGLVLYFWRFPVPESWFETFFGNTTKVIEIVSRMRINLLKSIDLEKGAVMAITDEESQALAEQSRKSADAVDRDYGELKGLLDAAGIEKEVKLLKEFNDNWTISRAIDKELLSLAVENTNVKAAHLSTTAAVQALTNFERLLAEAMDAPPSEGERAQAAKFAYQAVTGAFMIYSLEAPHISEARDEKMDEMEAVMAVNEKKVRTALRNLARIADRRGAIIAEKASLVFSTFMEVNKEILRLSRMNTNVKSLQLSLGRKMKVSAQCEELLNSLQRAIQGRSFKATR